MADCGICLDVLRNPVSIPCGHVHCERCLRGHISAGTDALKSTCPTCRKPFHIATPDFTFVPQKYHDFILPCVRKVYMDIPSVVATKHEIDGLMKRFESLTKENDHLRKHCVEYQHRIEDLESERNAIIEQEEEAREEASYIRKKYESLKKTYWSVLSGDDAYSSSSSQHLNASSREVFPKVEEHPVSLQDLTPNPPRPKRALPQSRLSNTMRRKGEKSTQLVKKRRKHQDSDASSSSQLVAVFKNEDDEEE